MSSDLLSSLGKREARMRLARDPGTLPELLVAFADDERFVRAFLAANPAIPVELVERLARDDYWLVRMNLAINPVTPLEVLRPLMADADNVVAWSAIKRVEQEERRAARR